MRKTTGRPARSTISVSVSKKRGKYRAICGVPGERFFVALGTEDRGLARDLATELELALRGRIELPAWAADHPGIQRYFGQGGEADGEHDPDALVRVFLDHCATRLAEHTTAMYRAYLKKFRRWLRERPEPLDLDQVDAAICQEFLDALTRNECAYYTTKTKLLPHTIKSYRGYLKKFYQFHLDLGRISGANPFAATVSPAVRGRRKIWVLERDELDAVLATADTIPGGIAAWIGCYSGLRRAEIHRLQAEDVEPRPGKLRAWESKRYHKGRVDRESDEPRWVDLCPTLKKKIISHARVMGPGGSLVGWGNGGHARWKEDATELITNLRAAHPDIDPRKIRYNSFRHTWGTMLAVPVRYARRGRKTPPPATVDYICAQLGNTSEVALQYYIDLAGESGAGFAHGH